MRISEKTRATAPETWKEASARLSPSLGFQVSRKQFRLWKEKGYDLHNVEKLRHELKNQQFVSKPHFDDDGSWPPTVARKYLTDEVIDSAHGSVDISDVLRFLRDEWEGFELCDLESQGIEFRQRTVKHRLLRLCQCIGIDVVADHRDMLCDELFGPD